MLVIGEFAVPSWVGAVAGEVADVQTLARRDDADELTGGCGLLVVDECHHVPAVTIQRVVSRIPARFVLGLTATPYRGDGLDPLIAMQCGPIRNSADPAPSSLRLELDVHETGLKLDLPEDAPFHQVLSAVADDPARSHQVAGDVIAEMEAGRRCLVLSERKSHLARIVKQLRIHGIDPLILRHEARKPSGNTTTSTPPCPSWHACTRAGSRPTACSDCSATPSNPSSTSTCSAARTPGPMQDQACRSS